QRRILPSSNQCGESAICRLRLIPELSRWLCGLQYLRRYGCAIDGKTHCGDLWSARSCSMFFHACHRKECFLSHLEVYFPALRKSVRAVRRIRANGLHQEQFARIPEAKASALPVCVLLLSKYAPSGNHESR